LQAFLQNLINGLAQGGVYALVALGYTMVYGVLQFINFAHSEIFMLGAFAGIFIAAFLNPELPMAIQFTTVVLGSMVVCTMIGLLIERVAYRPLRTAPRLNVLITAIGISLLLQNLGQVIFGSDPRVFPTLLPESYIVQTQSLVLNSIQVTVIGLSAVLMVVLSYIVHKTKVGMAMRAVSFDIEVASLMGIPTDRIIALTFIIGSSLAGCASILYGMSYPKIEPMLGVMIGLKAFIAAVFGGIGNIAGAAIGGILLGLSEAFVVYYISSSFRDAIAFAILILILWFRPAGLLGKIRREKV